MPVYVPLYVPLYVPPYFAESLTQQGFPEGALHKYKDKNKKNCTAQRLAPFTEGAALLTGEQVWPSASRL